MQIVDESEVRKMIRKEVKEFGSQRAFAAHLGVSAAFVNDIVRGNPGNVIAVPQTYNQHKGVAHPAAMPEGLAEFFIKAMCPEGGVVVDPFAGGGTTMTAARRLGRRTGGVELHKEYALEAHRRMSEVPGPALSPINLQATS